MKKLTALILSLLFITGMFTALPVSTVSAAVKNVSAQPTVYSESVKTDNISEVTVQTDPQEDIKPKSVKVNRTVKELPAADDEKGEYEHQVNKDGFVFVSNSDGYQLVSYSGTAEELTIPEKVNGYTVFDIARGAFKNNTTLKKITIPDTIEEIDMEAFSGCTSLEEVKMSKNVLEINPSTFLNCTSLAGITLPNNLERILADAFKGSGLKDITVPDNVWKIGSNAFEDCKNLKNITIGKGVTEINKDAFEQCTGIENVNISDIAAWCKITFTSSSSNPLCYANSLNLNGEPVVNLKLPNTVKFISDKAFYNYQKLETLYTGESATVIGMEAFSSCLNLTEVYCGRNIKNIETEAFFGCEKLTKVRFNENIKNIFVYAFDFCPNFKTIVIPKDIESIGYCSLGTLGPDTLVDGATIYGYKDSIAQLHCKETGIKFLNIEENPVPEGALPIVDETEPFTTEPTTATEPETYEPEETHPPEEVFGYTVLKNGTAQITSYSGKAKKIAFPEKIAGYTVTSIKLSRAYSIATEIILPDTVTEIGDLCFDNWDGLVKVVMGDNVTSIGKQAFSFCDNLEEINISKKVYIIKSGLFVGCVKLKNIEIPSGVTAIHSSAFENCASLESITIPASVISIGYLALKGCTSLKSIDVESGNTAYVSEDGVLYKKDSSELICYPAAREGTEYSINDKTVMLSGYAFTGCQYLKNIHLTNAVENIPEGSFSGCSALEQITLPDNLKKIWANAFNGCSSLKEFTMPDTITYIGDFAFCSCTSLNTLELGKGIQIIGEKAFVNCVSLKSVYVPDSVTQLGVQSFGYINHIDEYGHTGYKADKEFIVYGSKGSVAEDYTQKSGILFQEKVIVEPTEPTSDTGVTPTPKATKKANPIKITVKAKTVNLKKLKKKAQTVKTIAIKNAQGTIKVTKVKSGTTAKIYKKIKVNSKTGAITFKKGKYAKKTYKINLKITVSGNSTYKSKTLYKAVKVRIK